MVRVRLQQAAGFAVRAAGGLTAFAVIGLICFLPFAGRFLVVEDALVKSDALVVLAGARVERWLEGVELYREGWAPILVLSPGQRERVEDDLRRKGVDFPSEAEVARGAILQLGVPASAIAVMPGEVDNTAEEAAAVHRMAASAGWRTVTIVTSKYHSRRTRLAFSREFRGSSVSTRVRTSRFDDSIPPRWWRERSDFRFVTSELQKLLAYRLGFGG